MLIISTLHKHTAAIVPTYTTDVEVEICLRATDEKLVDALALQHVSTDSASSYTIGYAQLSTLIQLRDELRATGTFVMRTGQVRPAARGQKYQHTVAELAV
ncbi:homoserine dehydrogenase [Hymenobacter roseosalivarius DSM 11622]|uniref:Homoserine dehydrogenase n=1 Tax=Hymenobacter roseosalivarius DSM 11622 TaxID=645990 RepID=A0A1W1VRF1_9BACT|nr:hypothetical protein [Hymenobacter roseosalivarius]SMB95833.1 homoserine dehydrogenase [Hymenobacter roseosalivarius DSM 11622]